MASPDVQPRSLESLPWLPIAPEDFRQQCRALSQNKHNSIDRARNLAKYSLDNLQLVKLARSLRALKQVDLTKQVKDQASLPQYRLGLTSNGTLDHLKPVLEISALRHGVQLDVISGDFGQSAQEAMDPESAINMAIPDGVLIALDYRGLPFLESFSSENITLKSSVIDYITTIVDGFTRHGIKTIFVQSIVPPPVLMLGSLDRQHNGSLRFQIALFNEHLTRLCRDKGWIMFDTESIASFVGLERWHDPVSWHMAKLPFSPSYSPLYGEYFARLLAAVNGLSRKCLVLDLDNTLWGGVIGDDGIENIILGQGSPLGEAYIAIQKMALTLKQRGIILAVCSKNDEKIARQPFREHREMLLKESDIAVFIANWQPKSTNLELIAKKLNIGLDALVFLDDNPVERNQVRQTLSQVAVPELPNDPALFPFMLLNSGWFETIQLTQEDRTRAEQYQNEAQRMIVKESSPDIESYLRFLEMKAWLIPFDAQGRVRITQLINKTNQFNFTNRRYNEAQILAFEKASNFITLQIGLEDRFGDNGIISVVIAEQQDQILFIRNWVMSCRVFSRQVEHAVINEVVTLAGKHNITTIVGEFIPTSRNGVIKNLFADLGFLKSEMDEVLWELKVESFRSLNHMIQL